MKKQLLALTIFIFFFGIIRSQYNGLIIPNVYFDQGVFVSLPQPLNGPNGYANDPNDLMDAYDGQPFNYASNIITKPDGQIEFFIQDGYIYNDKGYFITRLLGQGLNGNTIVATGSSEVMVIPVPGQCNKYYIFASIVESDNFWIYPYVFILDMTAPSMNNMLDDECFVSGNLVDLSGNIIENSYDQPLGNGYSIDYFLAHSEVPFIIDDPSPGKSSSVFFAATDERPDGTRLAFVSNGRGFFTLLVSSNGISDVGFTPFIAPEFNQFLLRSEMEVVAISDTEYRIAVPYMTTASVSGTPVNTFLYTATLNLSGMPVTNSENYIPFYEYNTPAGIDLSARLRGVEFSKDGRYLYVTHTTNPLQPAQMEFFDFNDPSSGLVPVNGTGAYNLQHSGLEMGFNNMLLIAGENALLSKDAAIPQASINLLSAYAYQPNYQGQEPNLSSARFFMLQDQIDGMSYQNLFLNDLSCCVTNRIYDFNYFEIESNQLWQPGASTQFSNNLPQTVLIRDQLRVKAGTTLTLNNMTLKFSPEARLIVENGVGSLEGGKLILNNTTLTVDDRCNQGNLLWYGVEVWGNANQVQGTFITSNQGRMEMRNNSRIEKAWMGVLVGKRTSDLIEECPDVFNEDIDPFLFDDARTGGIIRILPGSSLINNQRGVRFRPYQNNGLNNVSVINDALFHWDGNTVASQNTVQAHVQLEGVKGIAIRGCRFNNGTSDFTSPTFQGIGIRSVASQFTVTDYCNSFIPPFAPCQNPVKTVFTNLSFGIHASNPLDNFTFQVEKSEFDNCARGVYAVSTRNERIIRNVFKIRQATYQTVGIYLERSSGYIVQENNLGGKPTALSISDVRSYGLVAENSGVSNNLVYKNTFGGFVNDTLSKLHVGAYAIKLNGSPVPTSIWQAGLPASTTGLQFRCNHFQRDIWQSDLAINGIINYSQGNAQQALAAANDFSSANYNTEHDITMDLSSQGIRYFIQNGPASHVPVFYTAPNNYIHLLGVNSQYVANKSCASLLGKPLNLVIGDFQNSLALTNSLKDKMKGGDAAAQLLAIQLNPGSITTRNLLIQYSPFLTDEVLLSYLNSSASAGMKKDVLTANTSLSAAVMQAVNASNLPQGTKNQIITAQNTTNQKEETIELYNYHHFEMDRNFNEALSRLLLDTVQSMNYSEVITFLNQSNDRNSKKILVDIHLSKGDLAEMELVKASLATDEELELDYFLLQDLKEQVRQYASIEDAMDEPAISDPIEDLAQNSTDVYIKGKSIAFLESKIGPKDIDELPPLQSSGMMIQQTNEAEIVYEILQVVSIYPNPSTGQVYFDYPNYESGILTVQLIDLSGKEVYRYDSQSESNGERVDLSAVKKGMYMARISIDGVYVETQKLLLR